MKFACKVASRSSRIDPKDPSRRRRRMYEFASAFLLVCRVRIERASVWIGGCLTALHLMEFCTSLKLANSSHFGRKVKEQKGIIQIYRCYLVVEVGTIHKKRKRSKRIIQCTFIRCYLVVEDGTIHKPKKRKRRNHSNISVLPGFG